MRRLGKIILSLLPAVVLALGVTARAQEPPGDQDDPIRLKSDLVSVTAAVTDRNGNPVRSLKVDDFIIYEDGVRQKITHFAATEEPFTLMLLLDISGSTQDEIALMKRAAKNFLSELRGDDRVGVIVFSSTVELIAELTYPRAKVEAAIDNIAVSEGKDGYRFSGKTGTSFYDALYLAAEEGPLKDVEGRKAIVCMSDGVDSTSKVAYPEVAMLVEKSEASIYFLELNTQEAMLAGSLKPRTDPGYINFSPSQITRYYEEYDSDSPDRFRPRDLISPIIRREIVTGLYEIARRDMRALAERAGGRVYPVRTLADLSGVYKQVADDLLSQYSLSYYSGNEARDGRWRAIRVEVRRKGAKARARSGYWAR